MSRFASLVAVLLLFASTGPVQAQVVESTPSPARTDQSVTITFHADRGSEGLADCGCDVYAHTGLVTEESTDDSDWQYVMDAWPENRPKTKMTKVGANTYELQIDDIRAYYSDNNTGAGPVPPKAQEEIRRLAFVFRDADGQRTGKTADGGDLFVDVSDVGDGDPFVSATLSNPEAEPPLYPFMTSTDTTVSVSIGADTANVTALTDLRLVVDGDTLAAGTADQLSTPLTLDTPGRRQVEAIATANTTVGTISDTLETFFIRTPTVTTAARPSGTEDGINYESDTKVTLSLNAPNKDFVYLLGDFNDWTIDPDYFMKKDGDHWWITLNGLQSGREYDFQYFVDGELRTGDPFARKVRSPQDQFLNDDYTVYPGLQPYPDDQTENLVSVLEPGQTSFSFDNPDFTPPPREDLVIYELLLRDFLEQHSFQALTDTLSYLDRLGVNAIELMPVSNFGGNISWGYNPNYHFALDKSYGPAEDLKRFVQAAHNRGIAVILDVVYNQITGQSPLVQLYGPNGSTNPFLEAPQDCGPFEELDQGSPFIQDYLDRANAYWVEEFNVDGFRFDLAGCIADRGYPDRVTGWKRMADHVWDNVDPDTYMILEFFGGNSEENALGGYRAASTAGMMTWHNMNPRYSEADMGYVGSEDQGDGSNSSLNGTYYENRGVDQPSLVTYMESHDEQWLMRRKKAFGNETSDYSVQTFETALNRQKLSGAFFFTVPGPRMMWQFGEVGYGWGPQECLEEDIGEGACTASDPGRTAPKPVRWSYADPTASPDRVRLYKTWKTLIALRNKHEVFRSTATDVEMEVSDGQVVRRIRLSHPDMNAVVIGNFGLTQRQAEITFQNTGTWYNVFAKTAVEIAETTRSLTLLPGEFRIYTSKDPGIPVESGLVPGSFTQAASVTTSLQTSFGAVTDQSNYRLVALPGSVDVSLAATVDGTAGEAWRAFRDDGSETDFLVSYDGSEQFHFRPGRGFWMLSETDLSYDRTVPTVALQNGQTRIPVHSGWNIISNPLALDVSWGRVQSANGVSAPLYRWNGGSYSMTDRFATAEEGEAFYFNNTAGLDSLTIPYPGTVASQQAAAAARPAEAAAFQSAPTITLEARVDSAASRVHLGRTDASTAVRYAAPRAAFSPVSLRASGADGQSLSAHVVPAADRNDDSPLSFGLTLTAEPGADVTLQGRNLDAVDGTPVTVTNQQTGRTYTLRPDASVRLRPSQRTTQLQVTLGSASDRSSTPPDEVALHGNAPNPFHRNTTIRYELPEATTVRLTVFDVLGRRVATLVDERRAAGRHEVSWAGTAGNRALSSGVYFLRLTAGDVTRTSRATLVR